MKMNGTPIKNMDQIHELILRWMVHQTYSRTHKKNAKSGPTEPFQKCSTVNFKYKILQITNFSVSHSE